MYFVYILKSLKKAKYYIGSTSDIEKRLKEHNRGKTKSTKGMIPLELAYSEEFPTNKEARKRESDIKKQKSRKYIKSLIKLEGEK